MTTRPSPTAFRQSPERRMQLAALVLRESALSAAEVASFRELFRDLMYAHMGGVWHVLHRRGARGPMLEDLVQEVFAAYFRSVCEKGFAHPISAQLRNLAAGKVSNQLRGQRREPVSLGVPSSGSEPARSGPDLARAVDVEAFRQRLVPALSPEQLAVVDAVLVRELSHEEAAEELGIARSTLTSRLIAAKLVITQMAALFFPPSQQG